MLQRGRLLLNASIAIGVIVALIGHSSTAMGQENPLHVTFTVTKPIFLSSEIPTVVVDVINTGSRPAYFLTETFAFVDRDDAGNIRPPTSQYADYGQTAIAPGGHLRYTDRLPTCTLVSESCSGMAALNYVAGELGPDEVHFRDGQQIATYLAHPGHQGINAARLRTPDVTYTRVPDPTATFEALGLSRNRLLISAVGYAQDRLFADVVSIDFIAGARAPQPPFAKPPRLAGEVTKIFAKHRVKVDSEEVDSNASPWRITFQVSEAHDNAIAIGQAVTDVMKRCAGRIDRVEFRVRLGQLRNDGPVFEAVDAASRRAANRLSATMRVGPIHDVQSGADAIVAYGPETSSDDLAAKGSPISVAAWRFDALPIEPMTLRIGRRQLFVADGPSATFSPSLARVGAELQYGQANDGGTIWPTNPLMIEAERTELYVLGRVPERVALRAGYDPDALALEFARRRATLFAKILGTRLYLPSAVITPRLNTDYGDGPVHLIGLAMTIAPDVPLTSVSTPPSARNTATRTVVTSPFEVFPILAQSPDSMSLLTMAAEASVEGTGDWRRLDIDVVSSLPLPESPALDARLRAIPNVIDVAKRTTANGNPTGTGFEIVVSSNAQNVGSALWSLVRKSYPPSAALRVHSTPILSNCADLERRALTAATQSARVAAASSQTSTWRLRKLLIASASLMDVDNDACRLTATSGSVDEGRDDGETAKFLSSRRSAAVTARVRVRLTYRMTQGR